MDLLHQLAQDAFGVVLAAGAHGLHVEPSEYICEYTCICVFISCICARTLSMYEYMSNLREYICEYTSMYTNKYMLHVYHYLTCVSAH